MADRDFQIGSDIVEAEYDLGLCTHTALSPHKCMTIPDGESRGLWHKDVDSHILTAVLCPCSTKRLAVSKSRECAEWIGRTVPLSARWEQPWVTSGNIAAYCGAPLTVNIGRNQITIGENSCCRSSATGPDRYLRYQGSLCVADDKPRPDFKDDVELALVGRSCPMR